MSKITTTEAFELKTYKAIRGTIERISEITGEPQSKISGALKVGRGNISHFTKRGYMIDFDPKTGGLKMVMPEHITKTGSLGKAYKITGAR
jgi:hypothetical protein